MEENASTGSGNSKQREEGMARKGKSKKRKNKDIEEKNVTRLLYNDTPSDGYDEEKSPSPKRRMKPPPFSKVWSDEDEISILRGMITFRDNTGRDAGQNIAEFHAFVLQSLTLQATLTQVREKIRRLREKYEKSVGRGDGSATQHELQLLQLCQKIWTQHPNSSATGQQKKQNIPEKGQQQKKQNIPEKQHSIPEIGHHNILLNREHKIIPETGLDAQTLQDLFKRIAKDIELVVNSKACLRGNKDEIGLRVLDITLESLLLGLKLGRLVQEKATSPELLRSPELLEQVVLRAYLEAKIEHAQLLLNAYNSYIKVTNLSTLIRPDYVSQDIHFYVPTRGANYLDHFVNHMNLINSIESI